MKFYLSVYLLMYLFIYFTRGIQEEERERNNFTREKSTAFVESGTVERYIDEFAQI